MGKYLPLIGYERAPSVCRLDSWRNLNCEWHYERSKGLECVTVGNPGQIGNEIIPRIVCAGAQNGSGVVVILVSHKVVCVDKCSLLQCLPTSVKQCICYCDDFFLGFFLIFCSHTFPYRSRYLPTSLCSYFRLMLLGFFPKKDIFCLFFQTAIDGRINTNGLL